MTYLLIKGQRSLTDVEQTLSMATFLPPSKIHKLDSWIFSKNEVNFNNFRNRTLTPCVPIWHYKNYAKGCRDCSVWLLDGSIKTDKTIKNYLKDDYCGSIEESKLPEVEAYVRVQVSLNAIKKTETTIDKHLHHVDAQELAALLSFLDQRKISLMNQLKTIPNNFIKQNY